MGAPNSLFTAHFKALFLVFLRLFFFGLGLLSPRLDLPVESVVQEMVEGIQGISPDVERGRSLGAGPFPMFLLALVSGLFGAYGCSSLSASSMTMRSSASQLKCFRFRRFPVDGPSNALGAPMLNIEVVPQLAGPVSVVQLTGRMTPLPIRVDIQSDLVEIRFMFTIITYLVSDGLKALR